MADFSPEQRAELRRNAEDALGRPDAIVGVLPPLVLALLDRLEAAEAELVQVGWGGCVDHSTCEVDEGHEWYLRHVDDKHELISDHPIWPVYARRAVPGSVAGEPESTPTAEPRWCVHHRAGWCAVVGNEEPPEGAYNVPTVCDHYIVLPGGYELREPDCADCLTALTALARHPRAADTQEAPRGD